MNILITGITGFVGSHMADYILANTSATIYASKRWRSDTSNIKHLENNSRVILIEADLLDRGSLSKLIARAKPDIVFHFAAQSFPESSFITPIYTLNTNIIGTTNLLDELLISRNNLVCDPIIVSISTSEVYGMPLPEEIPIKETNPIRCANPYSISKVGHDLISQYYFKAHGLKVIITRMFSHEGARRGKEFALSSFAYQIVKNEKNKTIKNKYPIMVGNLNSLRTYSHIEDAIKAYWLCATMGTIGEVYNIGGDFTCTVGQALDNLLEKSTIKKDLFEIIVDSKRIRPTDITLQIPDCTKFKEHTNWKITKTFDDITIDLLNYWRVTL